MTITMVRDVTHRNINTIPQGMLAGLYTTGSSDIKATQQDFAKHPDAVRICQDHGSDETADILDMETGAANPQDCANWVPKARASFNNATRPGQRWPGIYMSLSRVSDVANALVRAHITNVPLWIAEWGLGQNIAINKIDTTSGPFPIIAFQIRNDGSSDFDVFSTEWLNRRSAMTPKIVPQMPPGQWKNAVEWNWREATIVGIGQDGKLHGFAFDPDHGIWIKIK